MGTSAIDKRYGRRGGGWVAELVDGQAPFGVVDGERRQPCPTPVYVTCGCQVVAGWYVVPAAVGTICHACGERYTRAA